MAFHLGKHDIVPVGPDSHGEHASHGEVVAGLPARFIELAAILFTGFEFRLQFAESEVEFRDGFLSIVEDCAKCIVVGCIERECECGDPSFAGQQGGTQQTAFGGVAANVLEVGANRPVVGRVASHHGLVELLTPTVVGDQVDPFGF